MTRSGANRARGGNAVANAPGASFGGQSSQALQDSHKAFVEVVSQETPGTDLPRYVAVLNALLTWSAERPEQLTFKESGTRAGVIRFERKGTREVFWSAQVARASAPKLEIHLPAGRPLRAAERAETMKTLNAYSREALVEGDRLRIGFGALKNAAALAAVLALMERLLADPAPAADAEA